jgi:hypothetical protein
MMEALAKKQCSAVVFLLLATWDRMVNVIGFLHTFTSSNFKVAVVVSPIREKNAWPQVKFE